MANDKEIDYGDAIHQLHQAKVGLQKDSGIEAVPSVKPEAPFCSFCGKGRNEVMVLLSSPSPAILICNECVIKAQEILDDKGIT